MKNRNLPIQVKAYINNLFFHGCRWSMIITVYALIAVIIAMSSETCFSEGVYAAEVAYSLDAYDFTGKNDCNYESSQNENDVMCLSLVAQKEEIDQSNSTINEIEKKSIALSAMAYHENNAVYSADTNKLNQINQVNVNIMDSVVSDGAVKETTEKNIDKTDKSLKESKSKKENQEDIEAFQGTGNNSTKIKLSSKEKAVLMRIVEAEATGEDMKGKMLVANVVLNRVNSSKFPDTVEEVVFQKSGSVYQFSPIKDGRYYKVNISAETKKAVNRVLNGEDESQGALYFMSRSKAKSSSVTWFDKALTKVFKYGTHEFYK